MTIGYDDIAKNAQLMQGALTALNMPEDEREEMVRMYIDKAVDRKEGLTMIEKEQLATLGEYRNYFSEGLFAELTEPLFVKKGWVPQRLWNLISEHRLSYFEFDRRNTKLADDNNVQIISKEMDAFVRTLDIVLVEAKRQFLNGAERVVLTRDGDAVFCEPEYGS